VAAFVAIVPSTLSEESKRHYLEGAAAIVIASFFEEVRRSILSLIATHQAGAAFMDATKASAMDPLQRELNPAVGYDRLMELLAAFLANNGVATIKAVGHARTQAQGELPRGASGASQQRSAAAGSKHYRGGRVVASIQKGERAKSAGPGQGARGRSKPPTGAGGQSPVASAPDLLPSWQ
jgi:hypothetical protein